MKDLKMGPGLTAFIIFFGIAFLDALRSGNPLHILFWLGAGSLFLLADRMHNRKSS